MGIIINCGQQFLDGEWEYAGWGSVQCAGTDSNVSWQKGVETVLPCSVLLPALLQCRLLSSTCFMFQVISAPPVSAAPGHPPDCSPGGEHCTDTLT